MSDYEQKQFNRVADAFLAGAAIFGLIGLIIGIALGDHWAGRAAVSNGVAHWVIDPESGARTFTWGRKP